MENNWTLEKLLPVCNAELLRLLRATFWFQSRFSQVDEEEKFHNSEKFVVVDKY